MVAKRGGGLPAYLPGPMEPQFRRLYLFGPREEESEPSPRCPSRAFSEHSHSLGSNPNFQIPVLGRPRLPRSNHLQRYSGGAGGGSALPYARLTRPWHVSQSHSYRALDVSWPFLNSVPPSVRLLGNPPRGGPLWVLSRRPHREAKLAIPGALAQWFTSRRPIAPPGPHPPPRGCSGGFVGNTGRF